ncbi:hypothetical protein [Acanthamoeba polyphaga mimivirus]|uniref:Uncharacterized protein n=3 Tax=Megamimivirinae TaxID=3044648 RepID=A0A2L2DM66_MIMIV|nr:hypothetical protein MegaChil _gp0390 [Megavirus chiliensis]AEQ32502.1 hypothetical protein [Megavirus chiliensis]AGD92300.1 hypothetical protein LBA_00382 [Megavirus lba]AVG46121.1 hypothetical protein [Acanthamoeba polyphaga mimivirus]AVG47227.1 hypothetical protein [Acanthamoeba polyphaga mimivirus]
MSNSVEISCIYSDLIDIESESNLESDKQIILDKIISIYDQIFEEFKNGYMPVYSSNLFKYLTKEKFIIWVINNNNDILELFQK